MGIMNDGSVKWPVPQEVTLRVCKHYSCDFEKLVTTVALLINAIAGRVVEDCQENDSCDEPHGCQCVLEHGIAKRFIEGLISLEKRADDPAS